MTNSAFSEQSGDSDEENDKVMFEDLNAFRQLDYIFLFDSELQFSARSDFALEDYKISGEDFKRMRTVNRRTLTHFFKSKCKSGDVDMLFLDEQENPEEVGVIWADENLDEVIKDFL